MTAQPSTSPSQVNEGQLRRGALGVAHRVRAVRKCHGIARDLAQPAGQLAADGLVVVNNEHAHRNTVGHRG